MELLQNVALEIMENLKPVAFPIRFANDIERFSPLTQQGAKSWTLTVINIGIKNTRKRLKGKVLLIYWKNSDYIENESEKVLKPFLVVTKEAEYQHSNF